MSVHHYRFGMARAAIALVGMLTLTCLGAEATGDVIFYNGRVFTAEPGHPYADSVAIRGDRIVAVGALPVVEAAAGASARRVDLSGRFLMPGMIDAHAHPIDGGMTLSQPRYPATDGSVANLVRFVESKLDDKSMLRGDALAIYDLDIGIWSKAADIDAALSNGKFARRRIVLYGNDGHTAWANRAARAKVGITRSFIMKLSPGDHRYYGFDDQMNPNGFLVDDGKNALTESLPPLSLESKVAAGRAALDYMHSNGITGWLDAAPAGVVGAVPADELNDAKVVWTMFGGRVVYGQSPL